MGKNNDPAILFYSKDWLTATQFLSMEERGIYITLLMSEHQNGPLDKKRVGFLLGMSWEQIPEIIRSKFKENDDGLVYNERLENERENRAKFIDKQRKNGQKGGRPPEKGLQEKNPNEKPPLNPKGTNKGNGIAIENEVVIENEGGPGETQIVDEFQDGLPELPDGITMLFPGPDFARVWKCWVKYRETHHSRRYTSVMQMEMAMKDLGHIATSEDEAIRMIERAIGNGWVTFYKDKNENKIEGKKARGSAVGVSGNDSMANKRRSGARKNYPGTN